MAVPAAEDDSPDQENVGAADKPVEIAPETFSKEYVDGLLAEIAAFKTADEARKAKLRGYVEKHRAERAKKEAKT